jgi:2,4-dienoyl-CoA reductase-like NADH-dependent reductase (Old Yellow Enzyme family)
LYFAHGYLVSTFLSPITNLRKDKYGESLENRMRLGLEIAENVRKALPQNIVIGARVSVSDFVDNGWDVNQTIEFSK